MEPGPVAGEEVPLGAYSVDSTPSLHALGDVEPGSVAGEEVPLRCNHSECPCSGHWLVLDQQFGVDDCTDGSFLACCRRLNCEKLHVAGG